jgi:hypothetical protein
MTTTTLYTRAFKNKVRALVGRWKNTMYMGEWAVDIDFDEKEAECGNMGAIRIEPYDRDAQLTIYPYLTRHQEDLEEAVIHELVHCILEKMWMCADQLRSGKLVTEKHIMEITEETTSHLTSIISRLASEREDKESFIPERD